MYIWVVLATFIAILYAFNLSVRPDMREIYVEPQAEAVVTKAIIQHRGAMRFVRDKMPPNNGMANITYTEGKLNVNSFEGYLPAGFNADGTSGYTSMIYCINKNSAKLGTAAVSCDNIDAINYLVTYGCVPQRWKSIKGGRPSNDLTNAIQSLVGSGSNFGYTRDIAASDPKNVLGSTMGINTSDKFWLSIPQYIISADKGDEGFSKVCGDSRKCSYCLVYMTPFEQL